MKFLTRPLYIFYCVLQVRGVRRLPPRWTRMERRWISFGKARGEGIMRSEPLSSPLLTLAAGGAGVSEGCTRAPLAAAAECLRLLFQSPACVSLSACESGRVRRSTHHKPPQRESQRERIREREIGDSYCTAPSFFWFAAREIFSGCQFRNKCRRGKSVRWNKSDCGFFLLFLSKH